MQQKNGNYIVTDTATGQRLLIRFVPPVAALALIVAFVALGFWQLDRAAQKQALARAFADESAYSEIRESMPFEPYQRLRTSGRYLPGRQFLIDNVVMDGRLGYFVITPFEFERAGPLLLANRGWIGKPAERGALPEIEVAADEVTVSGLAGRLPRVAIRPGTAFADRSRWPRIAVYPNTEEIATELGRDVLPFVLLLLPDPESGLIRRWQPKEAGAMMHYGYAFQWFAMATAVLIILVWQIRKKILHVAAKS